MVEFVACSSVYNSSLWLLLYVLPPLQKVKMIQWSVQKMTAELQNCVCFQCKPQWRIHCIPLTASQAFLCSLSEMPLMWSRSSGKLMDLIKRKLDSKWIKLWHPGMDGRPLEALVIYLWGGCRKLKEEKMWTRDLTLSQLHSRKRMSDDWRKFWEPIWNLTGAALVQMDFSCFVLCCTVLSRRS